MSARRRDASPFPDVVRPYDEWRKDAFGRPEDAAYLFGYHLVTQCREGALKRVDPKATPETRKAVEAALDHALNTLTGMLEGVMRLKAGPAHVVEFALDVCVREAKGEELDEYTERVNISPNNLDLPIGYWKWVREREFRNEPVNARKSKPKPAIATKQIVKKTVLKKNSSKDEKTVLKKGIAKSTAKKGSVRK